MSEERRIGFMDIPSEEPTIEIMSILDRLAGILKSQELSLLVVMLILSDSKNYETIHKFLYSMIATVNWYRDELAVADDKINELEVALEEHKKYHSECLNQAEERYEKKARTNQAIADRNSEHIEKGKLHDYMCNLVKNKTGEIRRLQECSEENEENGG